LNSDAVDESAAAVSDAGDLQADEVFVEEEEEEEEEEEFHHCMHSFYYTAPRLR